MNCIQDFFKTHPALSVAEIERETGCALNTLNNFLGNHRGFPVKHTINLVAVLIRYGFQPGGWRLEYDSDTRTFVAEKPIPDRDIESIETKESFEYKVPMYRELIGDVFDLLDFLESTEQ